MAAATARGTMLHSLFTHAIRPAPQSSGPLQTIVHATPRQSGAYFLFIASVAWQHCAGTQSASALQYLTFAGVVGVAVGDALAVGDEVGVAGCCTHPLTKITVATRSANITAFLTNVILPCFL